MSRSMVALDDVRKRVERGDYTIDLARGWIIARNGHRMGYTATSGYRQVEIGGVIHMEHRLVWASANKWSIPAGMQINHVNGGHYDNRLANLERATPSRNILHSIHTLGARRHPLSFEERAGIAALLCVGLSQNRVAFACGVSQRVVWNDAQGMSSP